MAAKGSDQFRSAMGLLVGAEITQRVLRERGVAGMTEQDADEINAAFGLVVGDEPPAGSEAAANVARVRAEVDAAAKAAAKASG